MNPKIILLSVWFLSLGEVAHASLKNPQYLWWGGYAQAPQSARDSRRPARIPPPKEVWGNIPEPDDPSERAEYARQLRWLQEWWAQYQVTEKLGGGSFGTVFEVFHPDTRQVLAAKVITIDLDWKDQAEELKRETTALMRLRKSPRPDLFVEFVGQACFPYFPPVLVMEKCQVNLWRKYIAIEDKYSRRRHPPRISLGDLQKVATSILSALEILKANRIIHADIKPENMVSNSEDPADVKIIDFGGSRIDRDGDFKDGNDIVTLWYRDPAIILKLGDSFSYPVDMWAAGCCLAEIYLQRALWQGRARFQEEHLEELDKVFKQGLREGKVDPSYLGDFDQLAQQVGTLGVPPSDLLEKAAGTDAFFLRNSDGWHLRPNARRGSSGLDEIFSGPEERAFVRLLKKIFRWRPKDRVTPEQALRDPFITGREEALAEEDRSGGEAMEITTLP